MKIRDRIARLANRNIIDRKTFTVFRNTLIKQLRDAKANGNTK